MIASVGSTIRGASRSSTRTSPGPYITAPRTRVSLSSSSAFGGVRVRPPRGRRRGLDNRGVAAGGDDVVAGGQHGLGEVDAHTATGARDQPRLGLGRSHGPQGTTDSRRERDPVKVTLPGSPTRQTAALRW